MNADLKTKQKLDIAQIAQVAYAAEAAYRVTIGQSNPPSWFETTQGQRDIYMSRVKHSLNQNRKPRVDNPELPASEAFKEILLEWIVGIFELAPKIL